MGVETEEERGRLWLVVLDREGDPKEEENVGWRRRRGSEDGTALLIFRVGQYIYLMGIRLGAIWARRFKSDGQEK